MVKQTITIDKDVFEEFVSHTQTLVQRTRWITADVPAAYARGRLKELLHIPPFDLKRFHVRRTFRGYVIWDVNKQCQHRCGSMNSGSLFYTREKEWAEVKCQQLNNEHEKYNT